MTDLATSDALVWLTEGDLTVEGRLVNASNATLYCSVSFEGRSAFCVYKPVAGERPLWDFPVATLSRREVAAFLVSEETGWGLVPPTVWREGPAGPGMVQWWVEVDAEVDLVALIRSDRDDVRRLAVLDAVINNGDRKGGHLLPTPGGEVYAIDHGVTFAVEDKLRTLLWQWEGDPLPDDVLPVLDRLARSLGDGGELRAALLPFLSLAEIWRTRERAESLRDSGVHPSPAPDWPPIPWPPF